MSILRSACLAAVAGAAILSSARADDLAGSVAGKLKESGALAGYRVNVRAKSGTVWLEGRVADPKQLAAAVSIAENTPGVERVVNRLSIGRQGAAAGPALGLPSAAWGTAGVPKPAPSAKTVTEPSTGPSRSPAVQLAQALAPTPTPVAATAPAAPAGGRPMAGPAAGPAAGQARPGPATGPAAGQARPNSPRPLGPGTALAMQPGPGPGGGRPPVQRTAFRGPVQRASMRGGMGAMNDPMHLPTPGGYAGPAVGGPVADGQMVPGSMRMIDGGQSAGGPPAGGYSADGGYTTGGPAGGSLGAPMPMGGTGVGLPPIPGRGDGPNMPNYAWPSYSAYPNAAAVQYPTQYSPTAWPYIGPFYPYPQVPLGWRRVSLEWDDGWWWLDFDERHIHSHHR